MSLYTKSFGQRTDLNVFEWHAKCQLIGTPGWAARANFFCCEVFLSRKSP